jgi:eukaryotic-like serine/threonine-protein kinase
MHLVCPHCHNPIEIVTASQGEEILCPLCGSSFRQETESTASWRSLRGRQLGRFELIEAVGVGAFGSVYKARDPQLDRVVAIKIPRAGNLAEQANLDRFLREGRSVAQLHHPTIVPVHEVGLSDGVPYLVSEFIEGPSLSDVLTTRQLPPRESAELIATVADALQYAHERGVIHRDVKPSNILFDAAGKPHLLDFGLAKREAGEITMTEDGQILGTPAYMSPEQARGEAHIVGGRSDVYSLGAVLYRLLTGEIPFRGNARMLLHQVLHDEPRPPRSLNDRVPRDLETVCLKAMAKEPHRRYATAGVLADDLRRWLSGEPIVARPVGSLERTFRWCRRKPALAISSGLAASALVGTAVIATAFALQQSKATKMERSLRNDVTNAYNQVKSERDKAEQQRREAEQAACDMAHQRGRSLIEQGDAYRGLLWMARAMELAPADSSVLQDSLRTNLSAWSREIIPLRSLLPISGSTAVFSPDGMSVLVGGTDGIARLWRTADGTPLGPPLTHPTQVGAAVFSPDGKIVATASLDAGAGYSSSVRLWRTADATPIGRPLADQGSPLAFSPDSKLLATPSKDKTARLWRTTDGTSFGPPLTHADAVHCVAFSPDGKLLATASADQTVRLWSTADGTAIGTPLTHQSVILHVTFSPDGKLLATASWDGTARLWSTADRTLKGKPMNHQSVIWHVTFSPDGKLLATASWDKTARLWRTADGAPVGPPLSHAGNVDWVAFSPDGGLLATTSWDKTARLWRTTDGTPLGQPLTHRGMVYFTAFSPDGKLLATTSPGPSTCLWELPKDNPVGLSLMHRDRVTKVAFSPDGKLLATASWDKTARLWRTADGAPVGGPLIHQAQLIALAFSSDGMLLATASWAKDYTARLWRTTDGTPIGPRLRHQGWVRINPGEFPVGVAAVAFSPDSRLLATATADKTARVWSTADASSHGPPLTHEDLVDSLAFSPDGRLLATGSVDKTARLWRAADGTPVGRPLSHQGSVYCVAFSPDGKLLATASADQTVRLWSTADGTPIGPSLAHQSEIRVVAFSHNGELLATAGWETVRLWRTSDGAPVGPPLSHAGHLYWVAFSPDSKLLATASQDGARLWSTVNGTPIGPPLGPQSYCEHLAFSPDGTLLATASWDGTARIWRIPRPLVGGPRRIRVWVQVVTGLELDNSGEVRFLEARTWNERRRLLEDLGGPPAPQARDAVRHP